MVFRIGAGNGIDWWSINRDNPYVTIDICFNHYSKDNYRHIIKKLIHNKIPKDLINKFDRSVIFENKDFMVINKWTGISVQGVNNKEISIDDIIINLK